MSKYRRAARVDENQSAVVAALRKIPGITVAPGHDDILVGFRGKTYWYELKSPDKIRKRDQKLGAGVLKESQKKLIDEWRGHYKIVWTIDQILTDIGVINVGNPK